MDADIHLVFDVPPSSLTTERHPNTVLVGCGVTDEAEEVVALAIGGHRYLLTYEDADLIGRVLLEASS